MSDVLARADAAWDDGPSAGAWIEPLLGEWGATIGATVPRGYPAHAVVQIPRHDDVDAAPGRLIWLEALLDALEPFTGDQPVHSGLWEGWGWLYDHGSDPATAPGMAAVVGGRRPHWWQRGRRARAAREELAEAQAEAALLLTETRVERPAAEPLTFPTRRYFLWTGPLRSATALCHWARDEPPSIVWPEDRSWFLSIPEYTREAAVAGTTELVDAVLGADRLAARRADRSTELDIDD